MALPPGVMPPLEKNSAVEFSRAENQVAGHKFEEGNRGSLVDNQGRFYKPLQSGSRGEREADFYKQLGVDKEVPPEILQYFPKFYGCTVIDSDDGSGPCNHAIMENITLGFDKPSLVDIKMGRQTWYPSASDSYKEKCRKKDEESTTSTLGFRYAGIQSYLPEKGEMWRGDRKWCREILTEEMSRRLLEFACPSLMGVSEPSPELLARAKNRARAIYGGEHGAISHLQIIRKWLEVQTTYHFYSSSFLIMYEGTIPDTEEDMSGLNVRVKWVDFAHVCGGEGKINENVLDGTNSLIDVLSKLIT